jgi:hypothetical protein
LSGLLRTMRILMILECGLRVCQRLVIRFR